MKLNIFLIIVIIFFLDCAVSFQDARILERGKTEGIVGYSPISNFSLRINHGITGCTDLGGGLDIPIPIPFANIFIFGKQRLFSLGREPELNVIATGSYGLLFSEDNPPNYYQYSILAGIDFGAQEPLFTIGGGILQDPRYSYDFMAGDYHEEKFYYLLGGLTTPGGVMMQIQFIDRIDTGSLINFGIGYIKEINNK